MHSDYYGIQLSDGYIPIDKTEYDRLCGLADLGQLQGWIEVVSLLGSRRLTNFNLVEELFESTAEQRDRNREFKTARDREDKEWADANPDYSSD